MRLLWINHTMLTLLALTTNPGFVLTLVFEAQIRLWESRLMPVCCTNNPMKLLLRCTFLYEDTVYERQDAGPVVCQRREKLHWASDSMPGSVRSFWHWRRQMLLLADRAIGVYRDCDESSDQLLRSSVAHFIFQITVTFHPLIEFGSDPMKD